MEPSEIKDAIFIESYDNLMATYKCKDGYVRPNGSNTIERRCTSLDPSTVQLSLESTNGSCILGAKSRHTFSNLKNYYQIYRIIYCIIIPYTEFIAGAVIHFSLLLPRRLTQFSCEMLAR